MAEQQEKAVHAREIYEYLSGKDGVAQQELTTALHLSMPTVLQSLKALRALGLIRDDATFASTGGRKARQLRLVPDARIAIGIEITAHHVNLTAIDLLGHILHTRRIRHSYADSYYYYATLGRLLSHFLEEPRLTGKPILGVGIALSAIIEEDQRTIRSARLLGAPKNFCDKLAPHISLPFALFNDAKAGGYAEWWNMGEADRTILYLSLSNSLGGAMIEHHSLYMGDRRKSCEFGHMTLVPGGQPCYCGKEGCANAYLHADLLSNLAEGSMDDFFEAVEKHDAVCEAALNEYLRYLAILVNNLHMMYDCDIVLGGYAGPYLKPYMDDFREMVRTPGRLREKPDYITICRHRYDAAAVGAALRFVDRFVQSL